MTKILSIDIVVIKNKQTKGEKIMKIGETSSLSLDELKGALLTNEHGAEFRIIGFYVDLRDATEVLVSIMGYDEEGNLEKDNICGVYLSSIKKWRIQLQRFTTCWNSDIQTLINGKK